MTRFTDLTQEQMHLVNKAWYEANNAWARPAHDHISALDIIAELFQTAYEMGQKAPRPGDMVVAHFQENARSVSDGAIYAATSKVFSSYDKQLQNDIKQLLDPNACRHLNMQHDVSGSTCLNCGAQMTTIVRVDPGQEIERDDPHEDLGYKGRK